MKSRLSFAWLGDGGYNDLLDNTKSRHGGCLEDLIIDSSEMLTNTAVLLYQRNFYWK